MHVGQSVLKVWVAKYRVLVLLIAQPLLSGLRGTHLRLLVRQVLTICQHVYAQVHLLAFQLQHLLLLQLLQLHGEQILGW